MTNTTPTVRERFENELRPYFNQNEADIVWSFLEKELAEAEARGRQEMKEKCLKCIPEPQDLGGTFTTLTHNLLATSIKDSIQSL